MFSIGTEDLAAGLSQILLGLVIFGLVASVVGVAAKKAGSTSVALDVAAALSYAWIAICAAGLIFVAWNTFFSDTTWVDADGVSGIPIRPDELPVTHHLPQLVGAYSNGMNLQIKGLPISIRTVLFATQLLSVALTAIPAVVIGVITKDTAAGRPFAARTGQTLLVSAIVGLLAGIARDLLDPIGQTLAADAVLPDEGVLTAPHVFSLSVQLWPFAAALALGALAAVFRHGHRMQSEKERLQHETDGLV
jgi:hypothetical protein